MIIMEAIQIGTIVGIIVAVILFVGLVTPIISDVIVSQNLVGVDSTIANAAISFCLIALIALIAGFAVKSYN